MSDNLVCSDHKSDWIIARLARHLTKYNGWGVTRGPNPGAAVNVYFPYVFFKPDRHPKATKAVGFMTHREGGAKGKMWHRAAEHLDLCVCMAERYARELAESGKGVPVPVCYEVKEFTPRPRQERKRPKVGLGGTVYRGGRKGEGLALALYKAKRNKWDMCASGKPMANSKPWPIPSKIYSWADMPKYYHSLDVYVSTSTIEGGPVTVLEALGCGRPVVIGKGVGIESELPHVSGIQRYERGDLVSLIAAVKAALNSPMTPAELQALVIQRTPRAWARGWARTVEEL